MSRVQTPLVVAISGASGSIYGLRFVKVVVELGIPIVLTVSRSAKLVMREELGIKIKGEDDSDFLESIFESSVLSQLNYVPEHDLSASIASGSYQTRGMVVVPASTTCFSKIANGISDGLIERAAECNLKEGRLLVLVPRETPLSVLHLEHLLKLARAGVRIVPAIPAFYSGAQKMEDLVDFVIGKVLDQFQITHNLYRRWEGMETHLKPHSEKNTWPTNLR